MPPSFVWALLLAGTVAPAIWSARRMSAGAAAAVAAGLLAACVAAVVAAVLSFGRREEAMLTLAVVSGVGSLVFLGRSWGRSPDDPGPNAPGSDEPAPSEPRPLLAKIVLFAALTLVLAAGGLVLLVVVTWSGLR